MDGQRVILFFEYIASLSKLCRVEGRGEREGRARFERIRLDSGPGHRDRGMHREGRCLERVGVYYSPCFLYTPPLSLSLTLLSYPSPIYYFPLPPRGPVKLSCKFNSMQSFSFRFSTRRSRKERKGKVGPNSTNSRSKPLYPLYASALRIRFRG